MRKKTLLHSFKVPTHEILIMAKGERAASWWESLADRAAVVGQNERRAVSDRTRGNGVAPRQKPDRRRRLRDPLPQTENLTLLLRKHRANPIEGHSAKWLVSNLQN